MKAPWVLKNGWHAWIYEKGARPALEVGHNFSFVVNISRLVDQTTLALAPGHELRRATKAEVAVIKDVLTNFTGDTSWEVWQCGEPIREGNKITYRPLPEDQWHYFVVAFEGGNSTIAEIERALCIAPFELKIGFTLLDKLYRGPGPLMYHPARLFSQLHGAQARTLPFLDLTSADLESIGLLLDQSRSCDENLKRTTAQLLELDALPYGSLLLFLGYFAILESLLTHQPKPTDTIDSITRQVKQKVKLLENRWQPRIDYSPFRGSTPEKIWSTMYAYRSSLAHGGEPDFKKELHPLVDRDGALRLLKETVKGVLRQALIEPQLILDLRNC
jgi:Apea-like HEPN